MTDTAQRLQSQTYDAARQCTYIALDCPSWESAWGLVRQLGDAAQGYKVGLELFHREGPDVVKRLASLGKRIFLDVKLHDIPNTVAGALRAISALPVEVVNVHAQGGRDMLVAAREAVSEASRGMKLIAVTALTSLAETDLEAIGVSLPLAELVNRLVDLTQDCGLDGVVASAQETSQIRARAGQAFDIVVPGTRPRWAQSHDQKRTATPRDALNWGATHLVVGRAVTQGPNPLTNLQRYWDELIEGER